METQPYLKCIAPVQSPSLFDIIQYYHPILTSNPYYTQKKGKEKKRKGKKKRKKRKTKIDK